MLNNNTLHYTTLHYTTLHYTITTSLYTEITAALMPPPIILTPVEGLTAIRRGFLMHNS